LAKPNPIARRLEILSAQWAEFAEAEDARLLLWRLEADEPRMVETFLAMEADERVAEHPDVFVVLGTPFEDPQGHGEALQRTLAQHYQNARDALREQGIDSGWEPPRREQGEGDVAFFVRTCRSLIAQHKLARHLAVVLIPERVSDPDAYQLWLHRLVRVAPPNVRAIVLDVGAQPACAALAAAEPKRVMIQRAGLDMRAALEELSRNAGNDDSPGSRYRTLFVKLGNALGRQDLVRATELAESALAIATAQKWWHMTVPIHFALGGALVGAGRFEEGLARYAAAESDAVRGQNEGLAEMRTPCKVLELQSRLGRGSALIAAQAWGPAARLFEETAPIALQAADRRAALECYRLGSFCHERAGEGGEALRLGMEGVKLAKQLDQETLSTSSFVHLGEALMRLTESSRRRGIGAQLEREIASIAGTPDWRPRAVGRE
jgi:hypothetical protein